MSGEILLKEVWKCEEIPPNKTRVYAIVVLQGPCAAHRVNPLHLDEIWTFHGIFRPSGRLMLRWHSKNARHGWGHVVNPILDRLRKKNYVSIQDENAAEDILCRGEVYSFLGMEELVLTSAEPSPPIPRLPSTIEHWERSGSPDPAWNW